MANMENYESEKMFSLNEEMGKAIAEMVRCHSTELQTLNESHKHLLEKKCLLKANVIDTLATKLEKERKLWSN